jgi:hypothetical protein
MIYVSELERCPICTFSKFVGEECAMCPLLEDEKTDA